MVRHDLADVELADRLFAPHYARGMPQRLTVTANIYRDPRDEAEIIGSLVAGDNVDVFDISGGWAWVRSSFGPAYVRADVLPPR